MNAKVRSTLSSRRSLLRLGQRSVIVLLTIVVLILSGNYLYRHRPNLYDPVRTDLQDASRQLEIYRQDRDLFLQEKQRGTNALRAAITQLQKAATLDPNDIDEINSISADLVRLELRARNGEVSSKELHRSYQVLVERVDRLIKKQTRAARGK